MSEQIVIRQSNFDTSSKLADLVVPGKQKCSTGRFFWKNIKAKINIKH